MDSPDLWRAVRLKSNLERGGIVEHVHLRDITVGEVSDAVIHLDFLYDNVMEGRQRPVMRHISAERVTSRRSKYALYVRGVERAPIEDVTLRACRFDGVAAPNVVEHAERLTLRDVHVNGVPAA